MEKFGYWRFIKPDQDLIKAPKVIKPTKEVVTIKLYFKYSLFLGPSIPGYFFGGIFRVKTMEEKLKYIANDGKL